MNRFVLPAVLAAGALLLAILRLPLDLTFNITPLAVGVVALAAAAAVPEDPKPWAEGIITTAWGIGVLLAREGPELGREAAVFMIAIGVGVIVAMAVTPRDHMTSVARSTAGVLGLGGLLFYLAFDLAWLTDWWVFAGALAVVAAVELVRAVGGSSGRSRVSQPQTVNDSGNSSKQPLDE